MILVCDKLNIPAREHVTRCSLRRPRALVRRRDVRDTPQNGDRLGIAELALVTVTRLCVKSRRPGNIQSRGLGSNCDGKQSAFPLKNMFSI
jgi:hypothetical protein